MNVPILSKRRELYRKQVEDDAMQKAVGAVKEAMEWSGVAEKGFLNGNAALMGNTGMGGAATMLSAKAGASGSSLSRALEARVTQNLASGFARAPEELELALAEQGMSWGPPFPPGRPLDPFWGYRRPPRTWDYSVGENVQISPRWNRISFQTIQSIWEAYDVAQICTAHLINDVRSLEYNWEPIPGIKADVSGDIEQAIAFFDMPDKRLPFRAWLAKYLQDVIKFDAGALYIRRNNADEPIALEVISGKTIIPLVDFYGRRPEDEDDEHEDPEGLFGGEIVPAYTQIIEGLPWDLLAADDLIYLPWNPEPDSQYGRCPLERVLLSANTDIRFQYHFLNYFTEGTVPAGFMETPPDVSDPAQVAHWQQVWDGVMQGDQTKQTQIRWVPNGSKFTPTKNDADKFDSEFPLYLMRRTCAAHGITPADLGFTEDVNRASGDTQIDVQFRVGTAPLLRHVEDVINLFTREHLKLRCRINFDDGKETEDRVATANADKIYTEAGVKSVDEVRQGLGLHVDKSRPMPRYINNTRSGPIPLLALESMAGEIDPETYGPSDAQKPVATPFSPPPGVIPPTGSPEQLQAAEHTAQSARDLVKATVGESMSTDPTKPAGEDESDEAEGGEEGDTEKGADNTGGPGVTRGMTDPSLNAANPLVGDGKPTTIVGGTDGITVALGMHGEDLLDDDEDDEDDATKQALVDLAIRRWRDSSRNRLKKGRAPRRFVDPHLPAELHDEVWAKLAVAKTRAEVDAAFALVRPKAPAEGGLVGKTVPLRFGDGHHEAFVPAVKAERPPFHHNADAIVEHYAPLIAKALASLFSSADLDAAVAAGVAAKKKPVEKSAGPPPNLRASENSLARCANCCLANNPKCVKYGNWDVEPDQTCDGWEIAIPEARKAAETDPAKEAVVKALAGKASTAEIDKALTELYGDSMLQGAHDAARAAGATIVASLKDVSESVPADYWSAWTPGYGEAAAQAAEGGMKDLLDQAGITIQGLTDSSINSIGATVAAGLEAGSSVQSVGKELRATLEDPSRSETVANTETARATSAAAEETYAQNGIEQVEWLAEDDACPDCEALAAESPLDLGSDAPPDHPNCFPAGTVVSGPAVRATTMRQYQGDLVTVILESGKQFAVTPNHPILTRTGWCAAGDLDEGCDVLSALEPERIALLVNPDDYQAVALIEDVARASREALGMTARRVPMTAEDLHGDGTPGEYVDVVSAAGNPKVTLDIDEAEQVREQGLVGAVDAAVLGGSRLDSLGIARYSSSHRRVGSISECKAFLARRAGHPCVHRFAAVPVSNASLAQHPVYSGALNTVAEGERLDGLTGGEVLDEVGRLRGAPRASRDVTGFQRAAEDTLADIGDGSALRHRLAGLVEFDRVVELRRVGWSGHVFNLETVDGWYCANGIIAHNCRCAIAPVVDLGTPEAGGEESG